MNSVWPGPPTVMPFPLPWGQTGCCPPGGMDALMKCYCDIQQASAFIGQVMIDQINNNPAVTAAIIAAIEKSGSNLPLIGVTNGSQAQPGQVGEWVQMEVTATYPATTSTTQTLTLGVLQPGDWTISADANTTTPQTAMEITLSPEPLGLSAPLTVGINAGAGEWDELVSPERQLNISVPSLIAFSVLTSGSTTAGSITVFFVARRAR